VSAFDSQTIARRRYLMVAAGCAMSIFGYDPELSADGEPLLMLQYPLQARDIDIDRAQDRFYLASGTDGLLVRTLSRLEAELDQQLSFATDESSPVGCAEGGDCGGGDNNNDGNGDPIPPREPGAFTPEVGDVGDDIAALAATNVAHVTFTRDRRIFYINTPRPEDIPASPTPSDATEEDLTSYLVSVTLDANGVVEERFSVPPGLAGPGDGRGAADRVGSGGLAGLAGGGAGQLPGRGRRHRAQRRGRLRRPARQGPRGHPPPPDGEQGL
jgi:hypothetical protein